MQCIVNDLCPTCHPEQHVCMQSSSSYFCHCHPLHNTTKNTLRDVFLHRGHSLSPGAFPFCPLYCLLVGMFLTQTFTYCVYRVTRSKLTISIRIQRPSSQFCFFFFSARFVFPLRFAATPPSPLRLLSLALTETWHVN